ncbi:MAG: hypothetical protein JWO68_1559, partial [Actinomycetia bacterium]|nr:hypothetical protein [Actinomycetes bacterium]
SSDLLGRPPAVAGQHSREALLAWGMAPDRVEALLAAGAVVAAPDSSFSVRQATTSGALPYRDRLRSRDQGEAGAPRAAM